MCTHTHTHTHTHTMYHSWLDSAKSVEEVSVVYLTEVVNFIAIIVSSAEGDLHEWSGDDAEARRQLQASGSCHQWLVPGGRFRGTREGRGGRGGLAKPGGRKEGGRGGIFEEEG